MLARAAHKVKQKQKEQSSKSHWRKGFQKEGMLKPNNPQGQTVFSQIEKWTNRLRFHI